MTLTLGSRQRRGREARSAPQRRRDAHQHNSTLTLVSHQHARSPRSIVPGSAARRAIAVTALVTIGQFDRHDCYATIARDNPAGFAGSIQRASRTSVTVLLRAETLDGRASSIVYFRQTMQRLNVGAPLPTIFIVSRDPQRSLLNLPWYSLSFIRFRSTVRLDFSRASRRSRIFDASVGLRCLNWQKTA